MSYDKLLDNLKKTSIPSSKPLPVATGTKTPLWEIKNEGKYRVRILPALSDPDEAPFAEFILHLGFLHPNYNKKVPLVCLGGEKLCPGCDYYKKKNDERNVNAWMYKPNKRFIYYALNHKEELVLLSLHWYVHNVIFQKLCAQLKAGINIMDINEGKWLEIEIKKINDKYVYKVAVDSKFHKVKEDTQEYFRRLKPLDKYYTVRTKDEFKKIIKGEKLDIQVKEKTSPKPEPTYDEQKFKTMDQRLDKKKEIIEHNLKFSSDVVDSIDEDPVEEELESDTSMSKNMKRLDDILRRNESGKK